MNELQNKKITYCCDYEYASENEWRYIKELRRINVEIYCVIVV